MEKKDDFVWGVLLHLGTNMWHDWNRDLVGIPSSLEEERKMYPDRKVGKHGILPELVRNYLRADDAVWHEETEAARREGLNLVIIDIGEGYAFPSRPELHVNGSWPLVQLHSRFLPCTTDTNLRYNRDSRLPHEE